ncbi:hemerythrin domain-containing protein [Jatrophihabitans sp. GAS493]|uniref:hemerythrin domain-containing protein n=1 Tax=Jatrophihabitans sp. GAS493 TaxID=1907575 RepID=UPI0012FDFC93|nr:hemerythrin domain-containing protein [Jatrophihabitans sp. GAS493]
MTTPAGDAGVSRRGLLSAGIGVVAGAGIGVVVGAGAGAAITAAVQPDPEPIPPVSANEELMYDHGLLKRILLCYRESSRRLGPDAPVAAVAAALLATAVSDAAELIRDFIEGYHEGMEEAYVFPRLVAAGRSIDIVTTLQAQHDRGRHLTATILDVTADGLGTAAARSALRTDLDAFVRMYEPHEAWEDTVIFPSFREITPDATWRLLAERFASEQDRLFGPNTLTQMVERVSAIESTLGIHDLAAFTPTGTP